jgi:hypothetical protein
MLDIIPYCPKCKKPEEGHDHSACFTQEERALWAKNRETLLKEITKAIEDIEASEKTPALVRDLAHLDQIKETVKDFGS